jgi:hypothetical protein
MHKKILISLMGAAGLMLLGCPATDDPSNTGTSQGSGDDDDGEDDGDEDGETEDTNDSGETLPTGPDTGEDETGSATATDTADPSDTDDPVGFITDPDGGSISIECSVWDQDCDKGEKCMPWANDGGGAWNATRCSPLSPTPGQPGDPCTVEGSGVSGVDDCDVATMCWDVDPKTNMGSCVSFCSGSENNPVCNNPDDACSISNEGVLILCLPTCDPVQQPCPDGQACYPVNADWVCAPDAGGEAGAHGDPCEYLNVCDPGLICVGAEFVDDPCNPASAGCCASVCDLDDPGVCPGGSEECTAWYEKGQAPPGNEHIGACIIPG